MRRAYNKLKSDEEDSESLNQQQQQQQLPQVQRNRRPYYGNHRWTYASLLISVIIFILFMSGTTFVFYDPSRRFFSTFFQKNNSVSKSKNDNKIMTQKELTTTNQKKSSSSSSSSSFTSVDECNHMYSSVTLQTQPKSMTVFHHNPNEDIWVSSSVSESHGDPMKVWEADVRESMLQNLRNSIATTHTNNATIKNNKNKKKKNILILDIGANIGLFTLFFAHAGYRVHAFEPLQKNYQVLRCSILVNQYNQQEDEKEKTEDNEEEEKEDNKVQRVVLNPFGLSTQKESLCMYTPGPNQGGTYVDVGDKDNKDKEDKACSHGTIASFERLDTYFQNHLQEGEVPYMIKIDVEGHEFKALSPAKEYFLKYGPPRYIFSEFGVEFLNRAGTDPDDYLKLFWDLGMTVTHKGKVVEKDNVEYTNLLSAGLTSIEVYSRKE